MAKQPPIVRTVAELRKKVAGWRRQGETIALVPTMGALHAGHLSLVEIAGKRADRVVVSIFVNPTQFAPSEDFDRYPRDEAGDLAKLAGVGTALVYAPDRREMYGEGFSTKVTVGTVAEPLEGQLRPHFFAGVATVVAKLLLQCLPDVAIFGEKDYQQLLVIRQLAADLNIPVEIAAGPTVREPDGLAMSSRNAYLAPELRQKARLVNEVIRDVAGVAAKGGQLGEAIARGMARLEGAGFRVDYLEVRGADDLRPIRAAVSGPARVLVAAWLGKTRLIDNVAVA